MRRYLVDFSVTMLSMALLLLVLALGFGTFERLDGDLTRIGFYSERDFGWNTPQPVVDVLDNQADDQDAQVLVLGDSFSIHNVWQSVLSTKLKHRVVSFQYEAGDCFDGFVEFALRHGSSTRVIIETVERNFASRFGEARSCSTGQARPLKETAGKTPGDRATWPPELRVKPTVRGVLNALKMDANPGAVLRGTVVNAPLKPGCARFSNRLANRILYYKEDEAKSRWTKAVQLRAVARLASLQKTLAEHGKTMTLVIVPDKSSVYRDCLPANEQTETRNPFNLTQALADAGINTVDLLPSFKKSSNEVVDFYRPNDTHLSERGYIAMAEQLQSHLAELQR